MTLAEEIDKQIQEDYDNLLARAKQSDSLDSFLNDIGIGDFVRDKDGLEYGIVKGVGKLGRKKIPAFRVENANGKEIIMLKDYTRLITHGGFDDSILTDIYNTAKENNA